MKNENVVNELKIVEGGNVGAREKLFEIFEDRLVGVMKNITPEVYKEDLAKATAVAFNMLIDQHISSNQDNFAAVVATDILDNMSQEVLFDILRLRMLDTNILDTMAVDNELAKYVMECRKVHTVDKPINKKKQSVFNHLSNAIIEAKNAPTLNIGQDRSGISLGSNMFSNIVKK